jgi:hypothetical protein
MTSATLVTLAVLLITSLLLDSGGSANRSGNQT